MGRYLEEPLGSLHTHFSSVLAIGAERRGCKKEEDLGSGGYLVVVSTASPCSKTSPPIISLSGFKQISIML